MKARFLGCLVAAGLRKERAGFTVGAIYSIIGTGDVLSEAIYLLHDDDGDLRYRPRSDFEVVR